MKKVIVLCLGVLLFVSSTGNAALEKLNLGPGNVTASSSQAMPQGKDSLVNDSGMINALGSPGDGSLNDLVDPNSGNWANGWYTVSLEIGINQHPGAAALGLASSNWVEFDLGEVRSDLAAMGIWNGNEYTWGAYQGVKDLHVLASVDGINYSIVKEIHNLPAKAKGTEEAIPVSAVVDLLDIDAQYILLNIAPGFDQPNHTGDPAGDWERSYFWNEATYHPFTELSEVRFYTSNTSLVKLNLGPENVTASSNNNPDQDKDNLVDNSGMEEDLGTPGDGNLNDLVNPDPGNWANGWYVNNADLGLNPHPGAVALGLDHSYWVEFDLGEVRSDLNCMGIWNGNEYYWGFAQGIKDLHVLSSVDGINYSIVEEIHNLDRQTPGHSPQLPVSAIVDLSGIDAQYILLNIAAGWDLVGGTPGDWERNYSWDVLEVPNTYFTHIELSEVRFYIADYKITGGIKAHWPMDDGSGTTVTEVIAGNDGTISGGTTWNGAGSPDSPIDSLNFISDPNGMVVPNNSALNVGSGPFTVSFDVKANFDEVMSLPSTVLYTRGGDTRYEMWTDGLAGLVYLDYDAHNGTADVDGKTTLNIPGDLIFTDNWVHVEVVVDRRYDPDGPYGTLSLHADGELLKSTPMVTTGSLDGQLPLYIGVMDDAGQLPFAGNIDNFMIHDIVIPPSCGETGGPPILEGDVNEDCYVNLLDLAGIAGDWLKCTHPLDVDCD